jgi:hypothetical protein
MNKKPVELPKYMLEADPNDVNEAREEFKKKRDDNENMMKHTNENDEGFVNEMILED